MSQADLARLAELDRLLTSVSAEARPGEAIAHAIEACGLSRRQFGNSSPDLAVRLSNLGLLYRLNGDYVAAEPHLREALAINRQAFPGPTIQVASSLNALAHVMFDQGDYAGAERELREALDIGHQHAAEAPEEVLDTLNTLGVVCSARGRYAEAAQLVQRALDIARMRLGDRDPQVGRMLVNRAAIWTALGDVERAEEGYREALVCLTESLGPNHPDVGRVHNFLGLLEHARGDFAAAAAEFRQAFQLLANLGEAHPDRATVLLNLATVYASMGDYAAAEELCQQGVQLLVESLGNAHPLVAMGVDRLARLYATVDNYDAAEELHRRQLEIQHNAFGEVHPDIAITLEHLGMLRHLKGDLDGARKMLGQALHMARETVGDEHDTTRSILGSSAQVEAAAGNHEIAEPLFRQALALVPGQDATAKMQLEFQLAMSLVAQGRLAEVLEHLENACASEDRLLEAVLAAGSDRQRMAYLSEIQGRLAAVLSVVATCQEALPASVPFALDLVLKRKGMAAEVLAVQRDAVLGGGYPQLEPKLRRLGTLRALVAQSVLQPAGPGPVHAAAEHVRMWTAEKEQLESTLAGQIPEIKLALSLRSVSSRAVAAALPPETALVEFVHFTLLDFSVPSSDERFIKGPRYGAFVIGGGEAAPASFVRLGPAEAIDDSVRAFRRAIAGDRRATDPRRELSPPEAEIAPQLLEAGVACRTLVFDPLLNALGEGRHALLAPDGELALLPFEVLPLGAGRYVIDDYHLSYVVTGRDVLRWEQPAGAAATKPVVAADPDYDMGLHAPTDVHYAAQPGDATRRSDDLRTLSRFARLEGTRAEGESVARLVGVEPWLAADVIKSRLKVVQSPGILHIATHGYFLPDQSHVRPILYVGTFARAPSTMRPDPNARPESPLLRSGLALAGVNAWLATGRSTAAADDGILNAEEVTAMDLRATELVVLSACDTGIGDVTVGEGVFGFRRAFILAGAQALVMSLWRVPDQATRELMEAFYRRLLAPMERAEALRLAQLEMKERYAAPLCWGAFICQGNPGTLTAADHNAEDESHTPQRQQMAMSMLTRIEALADEGRMAEATATAFQVGREFGTDSDPRVRLIVASATVLAGVSLMKTGDLAQALTAADEALRQLGDIDLASSELMANALLLRGNALYRLGQVEGALVTLQQLVDRFSPIADPGVQQLVQSAQVNIDTIRATQTPTEAALAALDARRATTSDTPETLVLAAIASLNRANGLLKLGQTTEALASYEDVITRFTSSADPQIRYCMADALAMRADIVAWTGKILDAAATLDLLISRFAADLTPEIRTVVERAERTRANLLGRSATGEDFLTVFEARARAESGLSEAAVRGRVAAAQADRGNALGRRGEVRAALSAFEQLLARFGDDTSAELRVPLATALFNKGIALRELAQPDAAIRAFDETLAFCGDSPEAGVRPWLALALFNKATVLHNLHGGDDPRSLAAAIIVYDEFLRQFGNDVEAPMRERVARVLLRQADILTRLTRPAEAAAVYRDIVRRFESASEPALVQAVAQALAALPG